MLGFVGSYYYRLLTSKPVIMKRAEHLSLLEQIIVPISQRIRSSDVVIPMHCKWSPDFVAGFWCETVVPAQAKYFFPTFLYSSHSMLRFRVVWKWMFNLCLCCWLFFVLSQLYPLIAEIGSQWLDLIMISPTQRLLLWRKRKFQKLNRVFFFFNAWGRRSFSTQYFFGAQSNSLIFA